MVSKEFVKEAIPHYSDQDAETAADFINGLLARSKSVVEERPCGRSEGPCCGGKCGS